MQISLFVVELTRLWSINLKKRKFGKFMRLPFLFLSVINNQSRYVAFAYVNSTSLLILTSKIIHNLRFDLTFSENNILSRHEQH